MMGVGLRACLFVWRLLPLYVRHPLFQDKMGGYGLTFVKCESENLNQAEEVQESKQRLQQFKFTKDGWVYLPSGTIDGQQVCVLRYFLYTVGV